MLKVENYNGRANQFLLFDNTTDSLVFQSYQSIIAESIDGELTIIYNDWDYSKTTIKWFKKFVNEFTKDTYETKQQFIKEVLNKKFKYVDDCYRRVDENE